MKKRNCKIIMSMLCAAMCLTSNSLMVFADTNANINAIANIGVPTPIFFPINVASDVTTAECELGIPPAPKILLKLNLCVATKSHITLNNCMQNHTAIGTIKYLYCVKKSMYFPY